MSGGEVAYNLRPNKHIERQIFIDLLRLIISDKDPDNDGERVRGNYVYISLGGPQLEDQRLVYQQLGLHHLISIESDSNVWERQKFNRRASIIDCRNTTTDQLINTFETVGDEFPNKQFIIWLDYAAANKRLTQLVEFKKLLGKLLAGDVLKITLNANPDTLGEQQLDESKEALFQRRYENFKAQFGAHYQTDLHKPEQMNWQQFPQILSKIVRYFALSAIKERPDLLPIPLSLFTYRDGYHQMFTATIYLSTSDDVVRFKQKLQSHDFMYLPDDWGDVTSINVPHLTAKERLMIEGFLPAEDLIEVHKQLPFMLASKAERSLEILREYAKHYQHYPTYAQVIL